MKTKSKTAKPSDRLKMSTKLEIINPHVELTTPRINPNWYEQALLMVEECGRVSHKSDHRVKPGSAEPFIRKVAIKWGHESILEHASFTACFIGSRTMSHQLVRHRIAAYTQESQRYCDYSEDGSGVLKIVPPRSLKGVYPTGTVAVVTSGGLYFNMEDRVCDRGCQDEFDYRFFISAANDYETYKHYVKEGVKSEDARESLPNATKTEVYATFNLRTWRHLFRMRLDGHAQWQIKLLARGVYDYFKAEAPLLIEGLKTHSGETIQ